MRISEARKRRQLNPQELYQINWFLGIALAILSVGSVLYLDYEVGVHLLLGGFLLSVALVRPQLTALVPRFVWHLIPFLLVILLAFDLHQTGQPVPALIRLNLFLVVYRALAFRKKREDLQLVILCLFLLIIVGVTTVSFTFPAQVLLFAAVAMSFLFNVTLLEDLRNELDPAEVWRHFRWRHFLRKIRLGFDSGFLLVSMIAFGSLVVFSTILFLAIPRFDLNNPIPFLGMNQISKSGFSEQIRFGDVTDIRNDNSVALRVEVDSESEIPSNPYWRMLVLDEYVNGGFRVSYGIQSNAKTAQRTRQIQYNDRLVGDEFPPDVKNTWTLYFESGIARYLPLTGNFRRIRFQDTRNLNYSPHSRFLGMPQPNSNLLVYQVEDMEFGGIIKDPDFGTFTLDYEWYPEIGLRIDHQYSPYPDTTLALPPWPEDVEYLYDLVDEIGEGKAWTALEFAKRATGYLQKRHSYSLSYSLVGGQGDHVVRWLQSDQPGHCEAFAGSLLLICRAAGIPARIVTGFHGGSWNAYENYFMVRNSDAHAWVEIFDGAGNWIRVDPTPGMSGGGEQDEDDVSYGGMFTDSSFSAYLDSLRILWYRRIVSFDQSSQTRIFDRIQEAYREIRFRERLAALKEKIVEWWRTPWSWRRAIGFIGFSLLFLLIGIVSIFGFRQLKEHYSSTISDPVRRKSSQWLLRLQTLPPPRQEREERERKLEKLVAELQKLRFGRKERRGDWRNVLKEARQLARSWR